MPIGEFTKYGLVFSSSLIGAVSGYFYSSKPFNLRMRLERKGSRLLRPSDELGMYKRILKQKKTDLKTMKDILGLPQTQTQTTEGQQQQSQDPKSDLQKLKEFAEGTPTEPTDEQAIALLNWCQEKLTNAKYNSGSGEKDVTTFCEFPKGSQ